MKTQKNRVKKLEQKAPPFERQFISWKGCPWTEEQKAEAIRRDPEGRIWRRVHAWGMTWPVEVIQKGE